MLQDKCLNPMVQHLGLEQRGARITQVKIK